MENHRKATERHLHAVRDHLLSEAGKAAPI